MPKASKEYPPDEFDVVEPAGPRSPHRAPKSLARRLLPFLAAIILGPLLAYVVVTAVTTGGLPGQTPAASTPPAGDTVTPSVSPEDEDETTSEDPTSEDPSTDEEPTETETTEDEPEAEPDQSTSVTVLNSTGTAGLAGRARDALVAAGWADVSTGNHSGALPGSTVYYGEDDPVLEASARAVAEELGIDRVELDPDEADDSITVVLEADFEP